MGAKSLPPPSHKIVRVASLSGQRVEPGRAWPGTFDPRLLDGTTSLQFGIRILGSVMSGVWGLCPLPHSHQCSCLPGADTMPQLQTCPPRLSSGPSQGRGAHCPPWGTVDGASAGALPSQPCSHSRAGEQSACIQGQPLSPVAQRQTQHACPTRLPGGWEGLK